MKGFDTDGNRLNWNLQKIGINPSDNNNYCIAAFTQDAFHANYAYDVSTNDRRISSISLKGSFASVATSGETTIKLNRPIESEFTCSKTSSLSPTREVEYLFYTTAPNSEDQVSELRIKKLLWDQNSDQTAYKFNSSSDFLIVARNPINITGVDIDRTILKPDAIKLSSGKYAVAWEQTRSAATPAATDVVVAVVDPSETQPLRFTTKLSGDTSVAAVNTVPSLVPFGPNQFVAAWQSENAGQAGELHVSAINSNGVESTLFAPGLTDQGEWLPKVVPAPNSGFAIAWVSAPLEAATDFTPAVGADTSELNLLLYDAEGKPIGKSSVTVAGLSASPDPSEEIIAMDALTDGRIVIAWENLVDQKSSIKARIYETTTDGKVVVGSDLADYLPGTVEADKIYGKGAADRLFGLEGNDALDGGPGGDTIDGGPGTDTASYEDATTQVIADLSSTTNRYGDAVGDKYTSIENLSGSDNVDLLIGDDNANVLSGLGGQDELRGKGGNDTLEFGTGPNERADGGTGTDIVSYRGVKAAVTIDMADLSKNGGEAASDTWINIEGVAGGNGTDVLYGTTGNDLLFGYGGKDRIDGRGGDDIISGGSNRDVITGGSGSDTIRFEAPYAAYDVVKDFSIVEGDVVALKASGFRTVGDKAAFVKGSLAGKPQLLVRGSPARPVSEGPVLLYDTLAGVLSFDPDGTGSTAPTKFAVFTNDPDIQAKDIIVY